jgi:hypothetical protein
MIDQLKKELEQTRDEVILQNISTDIIGNSFF